LIPRPNGRAALAALLLLAATAAISRPAHSQDPTAGAQPQQPAAGIVVDTVLVRGNARLTEGAVRGAGGIHSGATVTATNVQAAISRLMNTGNFDGVDVMFRPSSPGRGALIYQVRERPLLGAVRFEGLESVSGNTVRDSAGLKVGEPLVPQRIRDAEKLLRDLLAKKGIQLASLDTATAPVAGQPHTVSLTFRVQEGNRLALADVDFRGNSAFNDEQLREAMSTRPEGFWWFRTGRFDREEFNTDLRENLPDFYASHGYIDFAVLNDTLEVDPQSGKARLVVEVSEGPQYRLGEFTVVGASRFPAAELAKLFREQRTAILNLPIGRTERHEQGEVFNRGALDAAAKQVRTMYTNEGYLYAQVEPVLERKPATAADRSPTVDVTLAISERSPFYVRNVAISGNTTTHEAVIRERLWVLPGDVYNEERVIQSYQAISGLGFFEAPLPSPDIRPDPETGTVDITFFVKEKQTGNINFGTVFGGGYGGSSGRVAGFLGYSQPNLFGQGKTASVRLEYGYGRSTLEASYSDPALWGTRNSGSVSVFRTGDRYIRFGNGRQYRTGATARFGFPVPGAPRTRAFVGYSISSRDYQAADQDDCAGVQDESVFCLPTATASTFSLSLTRDTKNHPLFPTVGTRQEVSVEQTGGPLGGSGNFQKVTGTAEWWTPLGRLGSGPRPARVAMGMRANAGTIFGDVSPFPFERFYVGGVQTQFPLRGYQEYSIGPRGYDESCRSNLRNSCMGDAYLTVGSELALRVNDMLSLSAFGEAGSVYEDVAHYDPTRMFRGAGVGATLVTPFLGAIGIDAAYGFDRPNPGWEIHFKLGQNF
jgi:outer membrane protein insertion porin family